MSLVSFYHMINQIDKHYEELEYWYAFIVNNIDIGEWQRKGLIDADDYADLRSYNRERFNGCLKQ